MLSSKRTYSASSPAVRFQTCEASLSPCQAKWRLHRGFTSCSDWLSNEAFITGQLAFDWATPERMGNHLPWVTAVFIAVLL